MFGAVFIFAIIICSIVTFSKNVSHNLDNRNQYSDTKTNTYLAYDGKFRDLDTGKYRAFRRDKHGDLYMRGEDISEINISQRQREEKYNEGATPGRTACFYSNEPPLSQRTITTKRGCRYKDYRTGEIYVVRKDKKRRSFYVTFNNKVVRYTDSFRNCLEQHGQYSYEKERAAVNEFQRKINSVLNVNFWKNDPTLIECYDIGGKNE